MSKKKQMTKVAAAGTDAAMLVGTMVVAVMGGAAPWWLQPVMAVLRYVSTYLSKRSDSAESPSPELGADGVDRGGARLR